MNDFIEKKKKELKGQNFYISQSEGWDKLRDFLEQALKEQQDELLKLSAKNKQKERESGFEYIHRLLKSEDLNK